ncbi:response regulator [Massilia sp. H-1]|nr:response regulator [Massilia sp. H-1]
MAHNGLEAIDLLAKARFDCVLMDVQMPVMDGLQATRLIRLDARLQGLRVLAMTATATSADRERAMQAGMDDFITKPIQRAAAVQDRGALAAAAPARTGPPRPPRCWRCLRAPYWLKQPGRDRPGHPRQAAQF